MTKGPVEVWRGGVNAWEIDEMGHFNVRFYVTIATEALAAFAPHLGMDRAFCVDARSTIQVREHYIRFINEARARAPIYMTAGVLEMGETDARLLFVLRHSLSDEICATFIITVAHVTADEAKAFAWSASTRDKAANLVCELPDFAAPRSLNVETFQTQASLERAHALGMVRLAAGAFGPRDCDVFGRMEAEHFLGRIVGAIPPLAEAFRDTVSEYSDPRPERVGGAALEFRLVYFAWPRAGDRFEIRSGVAGVDTRGQKFIHWLLDPASGKPYGVAHAYIVTFDLTARKLMRISDEAQAVIKGRMVDGITL